MFSLMVQINQRLSWLTIVYNTNALVDHYHYATSGAGKTTIYSKCALMGHYCPTTLYQVLVLYWTVFQATMDHYQHAISCFSIITQVIIEILALASAENGVIFRHVQEGYTTSYSLLFYMRSNGLGLSRDRNLELIISLVNNKCGSPN